MNEVSYESTNSYETSYMVKFYISEDGNNELYMKYRTQSTGMN